MKKILGVFYVLTVQFSFAQLPIADFTLPNYSCSYENIEVTNNSENSILYEWDFNGGDLSILPSSSFKGEITGSNVTTGIEFVTDSLYSYGFVCSRGNNKLFRLKFNKKIDGILEIVDLGNPENLLSGPKNIKFLKEGLNWYALVINFSGSNIVRLNFGKSLKNIPIATDLGDFGLFNKPRGLELKEDDGDYIAMITNWVGNEVQILNFGNSILNTPSVLKFSPNGSTNLIGASLIKDGKGDWYGIIPSFQNKLLFLDFGNNLNSVPMISELNAVVAQPTEVELIREGSKFYAFVMNSIGNMTRINLGDDLQNLVINTEFLGNLGNLSSTFAFDMIKNGTEYKGITLNFSTLELYLIEFPNKNNLVESLSSTSKTPTNINYQFSGTYSVNLTSYKSDGLFDSKTKTITVTPISAPFINFENKTSCVSNPIEFTSSADQSILSYNWKFGDGKTSTESNPFNNFTQSGVYEVILQVQSSNGCYNIVTNAIEIYDEPVPNFIIQEEPLCTNNLVSFINTSTGETGQIVKWNWNMNDETTFNVKDTSFVFSSEGYKNITLAASIPGCSSEISKVISITAGPLTNFSFEGNCEYDQFEFGNTSTGDNITGYQWDFGDGYLSSLVSPSHHYESGGNYVVGVTASNALGCSTTLEKVVPVRFTPELRFTNDLACSEIIVTLNDQTTVPEANIVERFWALESPGIGYNQSSSGPSPTFTLEDAGLYQATLIAESNYGCLDTLSKSIEVLKSPIADFNFENTCFGDSVAFTQNSIFSDDTDLLSASWLIDGSSYLAEEFKYNFQNTGNQIVELHVRDSNYCSDIISKSLTINPLPEIDFNLSSNCEDQLVSISSSTISPQDPINSYNWLINSKAVSNQPNFQYEFKKADDYSLYLTVSTENDCFNSLDKNVTINPSPVSNFDVFPSYGASPLDVQFTDRSRGAEQITYLFSQNNEDGSSDENPNYIYTEVGQEIATQIVENEHGCADTSTQSIEVVVPLYDITITNVSVEVHDEELKFIVGLQNNGTIIINNPTIEVKINGKITIKQKVETTLMPGEHNEYTIDFNVVNTSNEPLNYICFSIADVLGNYKDINPHDNEECINIDQAFNVLEPFPNPSRTYVHVPIILPSSGDCNLQMIGEQGTIVYTKKFSGLKSGLNMIQMDLTPYRKGIYLLTVRLSDFETTKKIVVQ